MGICGNNTYHVKGCRLQYRFISAIIGVILGLAACICFAIVYHNYDCAGWGLLSGVLALTVLLLHINVYRDITYAIKPVTFTKLKYIGLIGAVIGTGVFIAYLVMGILNHESGIKVDGKYIVTVWGWMTWKWGFALYWYSSRYYKALIDEAADILAISGSDYDP